MIERATGGPAFPTDTERQVGPSTFHFEGMTLRDYFASKAMQALIAKAPVTFFADQYAEERSVMRQSLAGGAYEYADAMIAERAK
jgi:hypothetical protein